MLRIISDHCLWRLIEDAKRYKTILYADDKYIKSLKMQMSLINVKLEYIVAEMEGVGIKSVYNLLYETSDNFMVIVAKDDFNKAKNELENMGLKFGVHFKSIERYTSESDFLPYYYDPILGYNLSTGRNETEGFCVFGDKNITDVRILTLGGSTTDAAIYPFKSWSQCLHEELNKRKINNVVFCGGVAGYKSSEELFKLIKDGFTLKPDIVINYSGFNDIGLNDYPYINTYMRQISQFLKCKNDVETIYSDIHEFDISWGIDTVIDRTLKDDYLFWADNQKMIHAACEAEKVRHITLFQPSLFNGRKCMSDFEQSYVLNLVYLSRERFLCSKFAKKVKAFQELAMEDIINYHWIYDLSGVFDNEDVYIDHCHLSEEGNKTIGKKIAEILLSEKSFIA